MRSTAQEYWIRSFVPIEKKSTSFASTSAHTAATGISTMMPTLTSGLNGTPSASSRSLACWSTCLALRNSSMEEIIGNMMRRSPYCAARSSARSWVMKQVVLVETDADRAVAEERVLFLLQRERRHFLIAADVQRADDDRLARHGLASLLVGVELLLLARQVVTVHEQELGAEQADALAAL